MAVVNLVKSIYTSTDVTSLGEIASGDTVNLPAGSGLSNPIVTDYTETVYSGGNVGGGTTAIDLANGTIQLFTLTANQTFTLPVTTAGKTFTLVLTGNFVPTINAGAGRTLKWSGGSAPARTASAGKYDIYLFTAMDSADTLGCDGGRNY